MSPNTRPPAESHHTYRLRFCSLLYTNSSTMRWLQSDGGNLSSRPDKTGFIVVHLSQTRRDETAPLIQLCRLLQSLSDALISLQMVYPRRNLSADQWRNAQLLSLISAPSTMLNPAQSDTVSTTTVALKCPKLLANVVGFDHFREIFCFAFVYIEGFF